MILFDILMMEIGQSIKLSDRVKNAREIEEFINFLVNESFISDFKWASSER